jgi:DNA-binding PadR family transcriptional regulator
MAKRRKVGNMLALAILSTLSFEPMHPYQMASILRERNKDRDMRIKWGTFYTVVANLEKHGFIAATENARAGARPERTVYTITEAGRAEMLDWVRELLAVPEPEATTFTAALSVMAVLGPDEVAELLAHRVAVLTRQIGEDRAALAALNMSRLFLIEAEYDLALREAELTFTTGLLAELAAGTLDDIDAWRRFHETGEVPADPIAFPGTGEQPGEAAAGRLAGASPGEAALERGVPGD